nr:coiled-coil domain-containing protein 9-like [Ipomoea batatas]
MALLSLPSTSTPTAAMLKFTPLISDFISGCFAAPASLPTTADFRFVVLPAYSASETNVVIALTVGSRKGRAYWLPFEDEKMTRRSPLDFPSEWIRPKPGRRPDIFPQFSPMKTPLPPPLPNHQTESNSSGHLLL